jgi:predicted RNA methylase
MPSNALQTLDIEVPSLELVNDFEQDPSSKEKPIKLGNRRVTGKEQYYTPTDTALSIMDGIRELMPDFKKRTFLEPAGGTGSFITAAKDTGFKKIVSYDIEPLHQDVLLGNFLEQTLDISGAITATNPPFGRCNSLSIPFFNHAAKYSDLIVFIVPRSWRKWSVQNKLNRNFHLVRDDDLTINYVDAQGEHNYQKNNLRTCIQYWKRNDDSVRPLYGVQDMGLITKCSFEDADVSLTIFGYSCGTVKTEFPRKKNTTQMFLKLNHPTALEALENVDFSRFFNHTAYTEALSIKEINFLLNEYIFGDPKMIEPDTASELFEEDN